MTTATVIQKVRSRLGNLDEGGEQIVAAALEVLKEAEGLQPARAAEAESFSSRNLDMEEYVLLSCEEQVRYQDTAEAANSRWIKRQFDALGANWIIVLDGHVLKHGASLGDYPRKAEIHELQENTGKCPFIFFSPFLLAIEESHTSQHGTSKPRDYYPALALRVSGLNQSYATAADMDTGALECYCDLHLMATQGIIKREPRDIGHSANHLS